MTFRKSSGIWNIKSNASRFNVGQGSMAANVASNHVLASLSAQDYALLRPHLATVSLVNGECLHHRLQRISHVYFPAGGVVSLVIRMKEGQSVEAGMIGRNGTIGGGSALDGMLALSHSIVQSPGSALRIDAGLLKELAHRSEGLRKAIFLAEQIVSVQAQQVAACNTLHELESRLARWLLQVRDLVQSNTFQLTQEFLAQMLGVQRTSVTTVARHIQSAGLIKYHRGRIELVDVEGLREAACECYACINEYQKTLTGWVPSDP